MKTGALSEAEMVHFESPPPVLAGVIDVLRTRPIAKRLELIGAILAEKAAGSDYRRIGLPSIKISEFDPDNYGDDLGRHLGVLIDATVHMYPDVSFVDIHHQLTNEGAPQRVPHTDSTLIDVRRAGRLIAADVVGPQKEMHLLAVNGPSTMSIGGTLWAPRENTRDVRTVSVASDHVTQAQQREVIRREYDRTLVDNGRIVLVGSDGQMMKWGVDEDSNPLELTGDFDLYQASEGGFATLQPGTGHYEPDGTGPGRSLLRVY